MIALLPALAGVGLVAALIRRVADYSTAAVWRTVGSSYSSIPSLPVERHPHDCALHQR